MFDNPKGNTASTRSCATAAVAVALLALVAMPTTADAGLVVYLGPVSPPNTNLSAGDNGFETLTASVTWNLFPDQDGDTLASVSNLKVRVFGVSNNTLSGKTFKQTLSGNPNFSNTGPGSVSTTLSDNQLIHFFNPPYNPGITITWYEVGATMDYTVKHKDKTQSGTMHATSTPEIDPGSMAGALTLLVGGVLTLTGRRRRQSLARASR